MFVSRIGSMLATAAIAGSAVAAIGYATAPSTGVIQGCYQKSSGQLRVVDSFSSCTTGELPISWAINGPAGPQGPEGPQGPAGPGYAFMASTKERSSIQCDASGYDAMILPLVISQPVQLYAITHGSTFKLTGADETRLQAKIELRNEFGQVIGDARGEGSPISGRERADFFIGGILADANDAVITVQPGNYTLVMKASWEGVCASLTRPSLDVVGVASN